MGLPTGFTASFRHPSAVTWCSPQATDGSLFPHLAPWAADGLTWLAPWNGGRFLLWCQGTSSPSFCRSMSAGLFLSHFLTPLQLQLCSFASFLYLYPRGTATIADGLILSSSGSFLELAGMGSVEQWGSFCWLLSEATAVAPSSYQNLLCKPKTGTQLTNVKQRKT